MTATSMPSRMMSARAIAMAITWNLLIGERRISVKRSIFVPFSTPGDGGMSASHETVVTAAAWVHNSVQDSSERNIVRCGVTIASRARHRHAGTVERETEVCIAGAGPAGMMLGLLLARQGITVTVLEKHADFLRDFRGDTVHPSTLDVLDELGLDGALDRVPHRDVTDLRMTFADGTYRMADFGRLHVPHPYIRFMPQWDFLNVLADTAQSLPGFRLLRRHEVVDVLQRDWAVRGVRARGPDGPVEVAARLTIGADGRNSVVRQRSGLRTREFGAPMDVLWFRIGRDRTDPDGLDARIGAGRFVLAIDRGEYWQIAYVIPKGGDERVRAAGIEAFRRSVAELNPTLAPHVAEVRGWDDVRTLTVRVDR